MSFLELDEDSPSISTFERVHTVHALLEEEDIPVAFQPIWDLGTDGVLGYEALARPHERHGLSGPAEAFEVAARIGRVQELDVLCVTSALARAAVLPADALLFLNLAPVSLGHEALGPEALVEAVEAAGLTPERVVIELTERTGARRATLVREAEQLREAGFRLAVDGAGAGKAGLDTLRCLEPEFIKIDRGVVAASVADGGARAVLRAIVAFAGESGAYVIAEGIEDEATLRHVRAPWPERRRGAISGAQGYHLGRPALAADDRAKVGT